jgi:hypothetical protein
MYIVSDISRMKGCGSGGVLFFLAPSSGANAELR